MPVRPLSRAWRLLQTIYKVPGERVAPDDIEYDLPVQVVNDVSELAQIGQYNHWIFGLGATAAANTTSEFQVNPFDRTDWTGVHKNGTRLAATAQDSAVNNENDFYLTGAGLHFEGGSGTFDTAALVVQGEPDIATQQVRMALALWDTQVSATMWNADAPLWSQKLPWYMPFRPYANVTTDVFDLTLFIRNSHATLTFNFNFWITGIETPPGLGLQGFHQ